MGGRGIEVVITFLHVLAVVALVSAEAEEALLEDRVVAVPQGGRETQAALAVGPALQAVLAPAVGAAARVVVGKGGPTVAVIRVILAHGAPLALAEEGPPAPPFLFPRLVLGESFVFTVHLPGGEQESCTGASQQAGFLKFRKNLPELKTAKL